MNTDPTVPDPLAKLTDDELLVRARDGGLDAFGAILARHAPWLVGRARELWRVPGTRGTDDWVATVHRRALADFQRQPGEIRSLRAWLLTILRHAVIDAVRRRGSRPDELTWTENLFAVEQETVSGSLENGEQLARVRSHLARLGPQDRSILEWAFQEGLGDREIGERLGMKTEAVKKRRQRALQRVREALGNAGEEAAGGAE